MTPPPPRVQALAADVSKAIHVMLAELPEGRIARAAALAFSGGGKGLRPIAVLLASEACGGRASGAMPYALAVELVHTSSLILDDLPAMDDAPLRRRRPALHTEVGDADAILTATALLAHAFGLLPPLKSRGLKGRQLGPRLSEMLRDAVGFSGMCEGQSRDLAVETGEAEFETIEAIHRLKTGALFAAALEGGGLLGGGSDDDIQALGRFGKNLGLAYQIQDDLLDATGDEETLGKPVGVDHGRRRTFVALFGLDASRRAVTALHATAREALMGVRRDTSDLQALAAWVEHRDA